MNQAVTVGFVIYLLMILVVGIVTARFNKTLPDFLLAGRSLGPWVVALSERASGQSGWLILGLTGLAYASGLGDPSGVKPQPALWAGIGGCSGVILSWILIAHRLRVESEKLGALTLPRFFELKFRGEDPLIRFVTTGIIVFCFIFYIAAQFDAAGKSLEQTFGFSHFRGILVGASIIVFYTLMGGFLAVAWTDFVQGIIMLVTLVILPVVALQQVGGMEVLLQKVSNVNGGIVAIAYFGSGHFSDPEKMMPALATAVFPAWFAGILICGALAAMMSTADSQLLVTTSSVAEDVYHQSINPKAKQSQLVLISRIVTVLIGAGAILLARLPSSVFDKVLFAWGGLGAALGPPLVLSLWWEKTSRDGVLAGMILGFMTVIVWDNFFKWTGLYSLIPGFLLSWAAVYLISLKSERAAN